MAFPNDFMEGYWRADLDAQRLLIPSDSKFVHVCNASILPMSPIPPLLQPFPPNGMYGNHVAPNSGPEICPKCSIAHCSDIPCWCFIPDDHHRDRSRSPLFR